MLTPVSYTTGNIYGCPSTHASYAPVIPKAGHRLALGMKLQKEVISNQAVKKGHGLQKARVIPCFLSPTHMVILEPHANLLLRLIVT